MKGLEPMILALSIYKTPLFTWLPQITIKRVCNIFCMNIEILISGGFGLFTMQQEL